MGGVEPIRTIRREVRVVHKNLIIRPGYYISTLAVPLSRNGVRYLGESDRIPKTFLTAPPRTLKASTEPMVKRTLRVSAWDDGFPLAVSVFTPESDIYDSEKVVVLINGATGCFQYYYAAFATYRFNWVPGLIDVGGSPKTGLPQLLGIIDIQYDCRLH